MRGLYAIYLYALLTALILIYIDKSFLVYLPIATGLPIIFYHKRSPFMLIIPYVFIEEALAYYLGGGLHGEAHSLMHDYIRSIPIFLTHYYLRWKAPLSREKTFYGAGSHGIIREIFYGRLFGLAAILFLPHVIIIYGLPPLLEKRCGRGDLFRYRVGILFITTLEGILLAMLFP